MTETSTKPRSPRRRADVRSLDEATVALKPTLEKNPSSHLSGVSPATGPSNGRRCCLRAFICVACILSTAAAVIVWCLRSNLWMSPLPPLLPPSPPLLPPLPLPPGRDTPVTVCGRALCVGGVPTFFKGVTYSVYGTTQGESGYLSDFWLYDAPLLTAAGVTALRLHWLLTETELDLVWASGIGVFMPAFLDASAHWTVEEAAAHVRRLRTHPAILGWLIGNVCQLVSIPRPLF